MVHGFSVGGYMYGELLVKLDQQREKYQGIRSRMVGQVFDSPVDFEGVAPGFASVLIENKLAQKVIKNALEGYLKVFKKSITSHYLRSSAAFHKNDLRLPSLMLYSRSDPIGVDTKIEQVRVGLYYQLCFPLYHYVIETNCSEYLETDFHHFV